MHHYRFLCGLGIACCLLLTGGCQSTADRETVRYEDFDDRQSIQLPMAKALGIKPLQDERPIDSLCKVGQLCRLRSGYYYYLSRTCTYPYLTPDARLLLDEIGRRYKKESRFWKLLRVSSCLRSVDYIAHHRSQNANMVTHSCHLYGTTFDISYGRMSESEKQILASVLRDLRAEGRCYVKYEVRQPCFHITLRAPGRPKPSGR